MVNDANSSAEQQRTTHRAAKRVSCCFPGMAIVRHATHNPKHRTNWAGKEEKSTCCMRLQSNKTEGRGGDSPVQYVSVNGAKVSAFSRGKARENCEARRRRAIEAVSRRGEMISTHVAKHKRCWKNASKAWSLGSRVSSSANKHSTATS